MRTRNLATVVLCTCYSMTMLYSTTSATSTRCMTSEEEMCQTLIDGTWIGQSGEHRQILKFFEDGSGFSLLQKYTPDGYALIRWEVTQLQQQFLLTLKAKGQAKRTYHIVQNCSGVEIALSPGAGQMDLLFPAQEDQQELRQKAKLLTGDWENNLDAMRLAVAEGLAKNLEEARYATLTYTLRPDGTFTRELLCPKTGAVSRSQGYWMLSAEGSHLVLHCSEAAELECLRIKHLRLDELVLEGKTPARKKENTSNLYFNKI